MNNPQFSPEQMAKIAKATKIVLAAASDQSASYRVSNPAGAKSAFAANLTSRFDSTSIFYGWVRAYVDDTGDAETLAMDTTLSGTPAANPAIDLLGNGETDLTGDYVVLVDGFYKDDSGNWSGCNFIVDTNWDLQIGDKTCTGGVTTDSVSHHQKKLLFDAGDFLVTYPDFDIPKPITTEVEWRGFGVLTYPGSHASVCYAKQIKFGLVNSDTSYPEGTATDYQIKWSVGSNSKPRACPEDTDGTCPHVNEADVDGKVTIPNPTISVGGCTGAPISGINSLVFNAGLKVTTSGTTATIAPNLTNTDGYITITTIGGSGCGQEINLATTGICVVTDVTCDGEGNLTVTKKNIAVLAVTDC